MAQIIWKNIFSVGVREIDLQHKRLIDFMNEIYARLENDSRAEDYADFFEKLRGHADEHFGTEEAYFATCAYPDTAKHTNEHLKIRERIAAIEQEFRDNPSSLLVFETLRFLDDWLFDHVMLFDKKYTEYFKAHGLS